MRVATAILGGVLASVVATAPAAGSVEGLVQFSHTMPVGGAVQWTVVSTERIELEPPRIDGRHLVLRFRRARPWPGGTLLVGSGSPVGLLTADHGGVRLDVWLDDKASAADVRWSLSPRLASGGQLLLLVVPTPTQP